MSQTWKLVIKAVAKCVSDLAPLTLNLLDSSWLTCFSANYCFRFCSIEASETEQNETGAIFNTNLT